MTDSVATQAPEAPVDPIAAEFMESLQAQASIIQNEMDSMTPMIAHSRAILYVDTMMRLHEAGLDEALKINDATQASAWMRDLSVIELALSLLRNIQPLDGGSGDAQNSGDALISTN